MNELPSKRAAVRKRILFSLLIPLIFLLMARPNPAWLAVGVVFVVAGEAFRIWSAGCISKNRELACKGPFAHVRNPLYFGSLLIGTGYCFMSGLWWSFLVTGVFYYWFYYRTILYEEEQLLSILGEPYARYLQAVPRLLPRLSAWREAEGGGFSWARVRYNREYESVIGVFVFSAAFVMIWLLPNHQLFSGL